MDITEAGLISKGIKKGVKIKIEFADKKEKPEIGEFVWSHKNHDNDNVRSVTIEKDDGKRYYSMMSDVRSIKVLQQ